ncbi:MAG: hypothetical protein EHM25_02565 [Nitrosopumilales archaeon]|nr:MAG: hypothetical protein EHM25_12540 [Nitrosopumilales archaeon]RPJ31536.1 MAG: hypothetical protein EHM25_02565 [Nitrosopumilales archaeon]
MNKKEASESHGDIFRCKQFEPIFKSVRNSYAGKEFRKYWDLGAGSASGKSVYIGNSICFWLPEHAGDKALVITEHAIQKAKTASMLVSILKRHGYVNAKFVDRRGTLMIEFGNNNVIELESVSTGSKASLEDRFKTQRDMSSAYKFIWFEEFSGVLSAFGTFELYESNYIRLLRQLLTDGLVFFTYNPSRNMLITSLLVNWRSNSNYQRLESTIYGLPERWQDITTLEHAEKMRVNKKRYKEWRHLFLGEESSAVGSAFRIDDSIWTELDDNYIDFYIQTDEATVNATVFALYGWTASDELHLITMYYHSSKVSGNMISSYKYRKKFREWYNGFGITTKNIATDGIDFAVMLREESPKFKDVQSVHGLKDRVKQYRLIEMLMLEDKFKIVNRSENEILYTQMKNAELEYNKDNQPMVSKKGESTDNDDIHVHALDTAMYTCLVNQRRILKGKSLDDDWRGRGTM